jgi:hypothetical protein
VSATSARSVIRAPRTSPIASSIALELWALIEAAYEGDGTGMYAVAVSLDTLLSDVDRMVDEDKGRNDALEGAVSRAEEAEEQHADCSAEIDAWRVALRRVSEALPDVPRPTDYTDAEKWVDAVVEEIHALRVPADAPPDPSSLDFSDLPDCPTTGMTARDAVAWLVMASRDDAQAAYDEDKRGVVRGAAKKRLWALDFADRPGWAIVSLSGTGKGRGTAKGEIAVCEDGALLLDAQEIELDTRARKGVIAAIEARLAEL